MLASSIPIKMPTPFGNAAVAPYIRPIPIPSQIGIQGGAASFNDGFPPLCFTPIGAGGVPPWGADFNGLLNQMTAWLRWTHAGGTAAYDAAFSTAIGGYPLGAILVQAATPGKWWYSQVDNNASNPDAAGANWLSIPVLPAFPTIQRFTTPVVGATYTPSSAAVRYVEVTMAGPGAGGSGATANNGATPSANTSFQVNGTGTAWTAVKGNGGVAKGAGGLGGTGGVNGSLGTLINRVAGGAGQGGESGGAGGFSASGGQGGANPFAGAGNGGSSGTAGGAAAPNSGGGGGGGGDSGGSGSGAGGGSGEYVEFLVSGITSAIFTIPAGGNGGAAGGLAGGNGATPIIIVKEFY